MVTISASVAPPQESELPTDHPAQEPLLLLRAKFSTHHHLPGGRGQQSRGGEQEPGEFSPGGQFWSRPVAQLIGHQQLSTVPMRPSQAKADVVVRAISRAPR